MKDEDEKDPEAILLDESVLTLEEISRACAVDVETIVELVEEGVLIPRGGTRTAWRFSGVHIRRTRIFVRLQNDLGVNLPGAALALDLLDQIEALRGQSRADHTDD